MPEWELSVPEQYMWDTIEYLLALPQEEREKMEQASQHVFTMESPAPQREPAEDHNQLMLTLQSGTMEATELLCQRGLYPAALNFAHSYNCGGGFEHASGSQEEAIFRTSTLFLSLWPHRRVDDGPGVLARGPWIGEFDEKLPRKETFYPHSPCGGIYSPFVRLSRKVALGRDAPVWPAEKFASSPTFGVVSMAAQDVPREETFDPDLLKEKARSILHLAVVNKHDAVVLGAFGCGFFDNPPDVVAETFHELLFTEFAGAFKVVMFAIPDRGGDNLDEFTRLFPLVSAGELDEKMKQYDLVSIVSESAAAEDKAEQAAAEEARAADAGKSKKAAPKRGGGGKRGAPAAAAAAADDEATKPKVENFSIEESGPDTEKKKSEGTREADSCCSACTVM